MIQEQNQLDIQVQSAILELRLQLSAMNTAFKCGLDLTPLVMSNSPESIVDEFRRAFAEKFGKDFDFQIKEAK